MKEIEQEVLSTNNFVDEINEIVKNDNVDFIDAVIHYCEINELEIESVAAIIKKDGNIKGKIQREAEDLNFLPKSARLPI